VFALAALLLAISADPASAGSAFLGSFGSSGESHGSFRHPSDVAVTSEGDMWVVDLENARLEKFGGSGEYLAQISTAGIGVATDAEGNVWVADNSGQIKKFDEEGELLLSFGSWGSGPSQFKDPVGIGTDAEGNVWVADAVASRIQEFNESGEFLREAGSHGYGEAQFLEPVAVDVGPSGDVFVADRLRDRVTVFDDEGNFVRQFGSEGDGPGQFVLLGAIAVDAEGNVWTGDERNYRVQEFNESGEFLGEFGAPGAGEGKFNFVPPIGLTTDAEGNVWVADSGNDRIQKWAGHAVTCEDGGGVTATAESLPINAGDLECEGAEPLSYEIVSGPAHGEITEFDPETGFLTYVPETGFDGFDVFSFRAENELYSSAPAKFRIQVGGGLVPIHSLSFGNSGEGAGNLNHPGDVAVTAAGDVWVVDQFNDRLEKFSEEGVYLDQFGSAGSAEGQFEDPASVAIDAKGNIWVADKNNCRIQEFDEDGEFIRAIGSSGSGNGEFANPEGIAIDGEGNLWVADTYNDRLQEFDDDGEFLQVVGSHGWEADQLIEPAALDAAPNGDIWVADWHNHRVAVFDPEGKFVRQFGSHGSGSGQFGYPDAIDVDSEGNVWVGDEGNDRIERFDETGEYLAEFGAPGSGDGQFDLGSAFGVTTDPAGRIWIADSNNNRVQRWTAHDPGVACEDGSGATKEAGAFVLGSGGLDCGVGEQLSYEIVSGPAHGEITGFDPETGALTYAPEAGFTGFDVFDFRATNGFGSSGTAKFTIKVGDGLVAAYSFDEDEGETAHDATGDHDAAIDGAEWVGGKFGSALRFDAEDEDSVTIPDSDELDLTSTFTLEAWVRPSEAGWQPAIVKEAPGSYDYALYAAGNVSLVPRGLIADEELGESQADAEEAIPADAWSHLALTSDGEDLRLYVDGELVDTAPARSAQLSDGDLRIGGHDSWGHWFDGLIDEVRIYNRALGAEEIGADRDTAVGISMLEAPEIWGSAMVGEELRALGGQWSAGVEVQREITWLRCDAAGEECEPVELPEWSEGERLRLTEEGLEHTFRIRVDVTAGGLEDSAVSPPTQPVVVADAPEANGPPHVFNPLDSPAAALVPGVAVSSDDRPSAWYPLHTDLYMWETYDSDELEFQWERCDASGEHCEEIEEATSRYYLLSEEDVGSTVRVTTKAEDSQGSDSTTSDPSDVVQPLSAPVAPDSLSAPGSWPSPPRDKDTLIAGTTTWGSESGYLSQYDIYGERIYQWLRCDSEGESCTEIPGAEYSTYPLDTADVGHSVRVRVSAANDVGEDSVVSDPSEVVEPFSPEAPELHPTASGLSDEQPLKGYLINATFYTENRHGQGATTYEYQWFRCDGKGEECRSIPGEDGWTYTPTGLDLEHTLRVHVKLQDEGGSDEALSDPSLAVKIPSEPRAVGRPTVQKNVSGGATLTEAPRVGVELRAGKEGVWGDKTLLSFVGVHGWQWQRCSAAETECEDIAGAWMGGDNPFYVPRWRDVGHRLRVKGVVRGPKGDYAATSEQTDVVLAGAPRNLERPQVLGEGRVRERYVADEGLWRPPSEVWFGYQWLRCGEDGGSCTAISGATSRSYVSQEADLGSTLRVRVAAYAAGAGPTAATSPPTEVLLAARVPEVESPAAIEGEPTVDAHLQGDPGVWGGALPISFELQWLRCDAEGEECAPIEGATKETRKVEEADLGATLRLEVTGTDDLGSASSRSAPTAVITEPAAPTNSAPPAIEGAANVGETVDADVGEWSPEPQEFDFQWQLCDSGGESCEDVEGATKASFALSVSAEGSRAKLLVTARNRGGENTAESDPSAVIGPMLIPVNEEAPWFSETPRESRPLSVKVGSWSGGRPMSFTYQWLLCDGSGEECAEIPGATGATYTPVAEDFDLRLKVEVTATNESGGTTEVSERSGRVQKSAPWFSGSPTITGEMTEGSEVSADLSVLHGSAPMEMDYEWQRCFERCVTIPAAESQDYTLTAADVAHRLRVTVIAQNELGEAERVSSYGDFVAPLETEGQPVAASPPEIEGMPRATESLTAGDGAWRGATPIGTEVRWQRCTAGVETCADIEEAIGGSYELGAEDVGMRIRAVVTAENGEGSAEAGSILTAPILPAVDTVFTLDGELTIEDVLEKAEAAGTPIVAIAFHSGSDSGYYSGGVAGTMANDVSTGLSKLKIDQKEHRVTSLTLSGHFEIEPFWGGLPNWIPHVDRDETQPSIDLNPNPTPPEPELEEAEEVGYNGVELAMGAKLIAFGWPCAGDGCSEEALPEASELISIAPRQMEMSMTWGQTAEEMEGWIDEYGPLALEYDVKMVNPNNDPGKLTGVNCSEQEERDFWISDRDDETFISDIPYDAGGAYWDTATLDPCTIKDVTFGVMHPEDLEFGEKYTTSVGFPNAGNLRSSPVQWQLELLHRQELPFTECDFSPWCVNIPPFATGYVATQPLIELEDEFEFPGCYEYEGGRRKADECSFPT